MSWFTLKSEEVYLLIFLNAIINFQLDLLGFCTAVSVSPFLKL